MTALSMSSIGIGFGRDSVASLGLIYTPVQQVYGGGVRLQYSSWLNSPRIRNSKKGASLLARRIHEEDLFIMESVQVMIAMGVFNE